MPLPLPGEHLRASKLFTGPTSYVPTLTSDGTNPTLGTGSVATGFYYRLGNLIFVWGRLSFGTSGAAAGTGNYKISLPVAADTTWMFANVGTALGHPVGPVTLRDNSSVAQSEAAVAHLYDASTIWVLTSFDHADTTAPFASGVVGAARPWTWAASDTINFHAAYMVA